MKRLAPLARRLVLLPLLAAIACGPREKDDAPPPPPAKSDDAGSGGGLSGLMGGPFGPLGMMLGGSLDKPGPYEELRASADFKADAPHFAILELSGTITEMAGASLLGGGATVELEALLRRLDALAADPNVKGLVVRVGDVSVDMATAEEVRAAFARFAGGKPLHCHADEATNTKYMLMTGCQKIGVEELGAVMITGAAATPIHFKTLLDRIGVTADFVHVGAFKGAAEPITREAPSPEMIETLEAIVARHHATLVQAIADGRHLDADVAAARVDAALYLGADAREGGLVDELGGFPAFRDAAVAGAPWTQVKVSEKSGKFDLGALQRFLGARPPERPEAPHVGLIYALGTIVDGDAGGALGARSQIAARTLSAAIRAMGRDDKVAAIVLRINSGGGSANASEQIWQAVAEARESKPVVVSMGPVAASGGYYIAAGATKIFALPTTLTGSIGVVGGKLAMRGVADKLGVSVHEVHRGERALMWSAMDPWTTGERAAVQAMMERVYERFVARVAEGRKQTADQIKGVAEGRVWTGADAKGHGLVDELGGLADALAAARELGGVDPATALEVYPPEPTLRDIVASFEDGPPGLVSLGPALELAAELDPQLAAAVTRQLRALLLLRESRVLAIGELPLVR